MKVLLCMIYLHLIDDYVLQGILTKLKQRSFWTPYGDKYQSDYAIALFEHGFMNSFLVHIPIYLWLCKNEVVLFASVFLLGTFHAMIDDFKANQKKINLTQDQLLHIILIVIWWILFSLVGGQI